MMTDEKVMQENNELNNDKINVGETETVATETVVTETNATETKAAENNSAETKNEQTNSSSTESTPTNSNATKLANGNTDSSVQLTNLEEALVESSAESRNANLNLLMNIPLELSVEIGRTKKKIKDILDMRHGTIVEFDKLANDPVEILVNGQLVAKGNVVVIDDCFGVRVTEIISYEEIFEKLT